MTARVAAVLGLFLASIAGAQQTAPLSEAISVQLTNLDVVVTDGSGTAVHGLTADAFEVLENGAPRQITNCSEVTRIAAVAAPAATAPRRIMIVIDNGTIPQSAQKKTLAALRTVLADLVGETDRLMVVTVAGSAQVRAGWTSNRAEIERALQSVAKDPAAPRLELAELNNMIGRMLAMSSDGGPRSSALSMRRPKAGSSRAPNENEQQDETQTERELPEVDFNTVLQHTRAFASSREAETRRTLSALEGSLGWFNGASGGRRLVLLVGGALPLLPGADLFQRLESARRDIERRESIAAGGKRDLQYDSPVLDRTAYDVTKYVDALAASARMKGIAFYAVNPEVNDRQTKEISSHNAGGAGVDFAALNASIDGFQRLAAQTGGESHVGRRAEVALADVRRDLDSYYSLGFRSTSPVTPDTKIVVKMKNGLQARATISSAPVSPEWQLADRVLSNHFAEPTDNDLGISLASDKAITGGDGTKRVTVRVLIPFDHLQLIREKSAYRSAFTVFVSVGDAAGGAAPQSETRTLNFDEATVQKLRGHNIAYGVNLTLGPGRDRVSVGLLDTTSGKTGFARLVVP